ncbi:MAG: ankyrin repeat protein [Chlamydiales bacterium]|jgi:ankyrin repeat protein
MPAYLTWKEPKIIDKRCSFDKEDEDGATQLLIACQYGMEKSALKLLDKGATPRTHACGYMNPLHMAATQGLHTVSKLITKHTKILSNIEDSNLYNPLITYIVWQSNYRQYFKRVFRYFLEAKYFKR